MLRLTWSPTARSDLRGILDYIASDNEAAAERLRQRIDHVLDIATQLPHAFRKGRVAGTHEVLATPNYLVVYRVLDDEIRVDRIIHTKRLYP